MNCTCNKPVLHDEESVCCYQCDKWHHIRCVRLSAKQLEIITDLGAQVEWFCPSCRKKKTKPSHGDSIKQDIADIHKAIAENAKAIKNIANI